MYETQITYIRNLFRPFFWFIVYLVLFVFSAWFNVFNGVWWYYYSFSVIIVGAMTFLLEQKLHPTFLGKVFFYDDMVRMTFNRFSMFHPLKNVVEIIYFYRGYNGKATLPRARGASGDNALRIVYEEKVFQYSIYLKNHSDALMMYRTLAEWRNRDVKVTIRKEVLWGIHTKGFIFFDDLFFYAKRICFKYKWHSNGKSISDFKVFPS